MVKVLIQKSCVDLRGDVLHIAMQCGNLDGVKLLVEKTDLDAQDMEGWTARRYAALFQPSGEWSHEFVPFLRRMTGGNPEPGDY